MVKLKEAVKKQSSQKGGSCLWIPCCYLSREGKAYYRDPRS